MIGYKVVPVEPTAEMMATGGIEMGARDEDSRPVWKAMLAVAPDVQGELDVPALVEALTTDLSARINRVSRRSLDGTVIMSSEEWNGIVKLVGKLLTAAHRKGDSDHG